jgi:hypothetical protein
MGQAQRDAGHSGDGDARQHRAGDLARLQGHGDRQADQGNDRTGLRKVAQGQGVGLDVQRHHAGVATSQHGDEQADRGAQSQLDLRRDHPHHQLARAGQGEDHEQQARGHGDGQAGGERHVLQMRQGHAQDHRAADAGTDDERQVGVDAHGDAAQGHDQDRGGGRRAAVHAAGRQQRGDHDDQIGGGQEAGQAGQHLAADRGLACAQREAAIEEGGEAVHFEACATKVSTKRSTSMARTMWTSRSPALGAISALQTTGWP